MKLKDLIKFRIDNNLSSKEMADKLNVTASTYSRLENGKKKPTLDLVYSLCNGFGISKEAAIELLEI